MNPIVALVTFFVGVSAVSIWLINLHQYSHKPEIPSVSVSVDEAVTQTRPETERYAVYSALIKDMYVDERAKLLVIERVDTCPRPSEGNKASDEKVEDFRQQMEDYATKELPELKRETIDDFHAKMKECFSLKSQLDIPVKYVLVSDKDLEPLFPKGEFDRAWKRFYDKYPNSSGIINFSNVGFNREMNQALVATGNVCGGLCGAGYYVLLRKEQGVWKVQSKTMNVELQRRFHARGQNVRSN